MTFFIYPIKSSGRILRYRYIESDTRVGALSNIHVLGPIITSNVIITKSSSKFALLSVLRTPDSKKELIIIMSVVSLSCNLSPWIDF